MIRLGTSSYIIEGSLLENVRYLGPKVDDVELVLFETEELSNIPNSEEIFELHQLAKRYKLTYTVHLPMDTYPGALDEKIRKQSVELIIRVIEVTKALNPFGYILHFTPESYGPIPAQNIPAWLNQSEKSIVEILNQTKIEPSILGIETLSYPVSLVDPLIERYDLGVVLDIGHLHLMGYDVEDHFRRYINRCRTIHLHGVEEGVDHLGLHRGDRKKIDEFLRLLEYADDALERVVTLEVFDQEGFEGSMGVLREERREEKSNVSDRRRTKWEILLGGSVRSRS